ncbi:hypothetical protein NHJ13734_009893 [Beauveria thailandica]
MRIHSHLRTVCATILLWGVSNASLLLTLDNGPELDASKAEHFGDDSVSGWLLLNYVGPDTVHFAASGAGDDNGDGRGAVEQLRENLNDSQIQYALVRIGGIQEKGSLKSTVRDVFVTWIGPDGGHNIAAKILDVLTAYETQDKIEYFTLDNAESNNEAMSVIGDKLGFMESISRGRYFGHSLNPSAESLLFRYNVEAFEEQLSGAARFRGQSTLRGAVKGLWEAT